MKTAWNLLGLFVLLGGLAFFAAWQWQRLFPAHQAIQSSCDPGQQDCASRLPDGGELHLGITPRPVQLMQQMQINLSIKDSEFQPSHLDITGINMPMGLNRVVFEGQKESWRGETILPICSQRQMLWQTQLVLKQGDELYRLNYQFKTNR